MSAQRLYYACWNDGADVSAIPPSWKPCLWLSNYGPLQGVGAAVQLAKTGGLWPSGPTPLIGLAPAIPSGSFLALNLEGWSDADARRAIDVAQRALPSSQFCAYGFIADGLPTGMSVNSPRPQILAEMEQRATAMMPQGKKSVIQCYPYFGQQYDQMYGWLTEIAVHRKYFQTAVAWGCGAFMPTPTTPGGAFDAEFMAVYVAFLKLFDVVVAWGPISTCIDLMRLLK